MNTTKPHIDKGKGEVIILLHGLFGALSNWKSVVDFFSKKYRVIIPKIPLTDVDVEDANLESFGQRVVPDYHFDKADVIVSFGADFIGNWLSQDYSNDYIAGRNPKSGKMSRHFQKL